MTNEIMNKCCCKSKTESACKMEDENLCPVCKKSGVKVENFTVKYLVVDLLTELVGDTDYYLCMDEECDIAYYNKKTCVQFNKQEVKVPIW